MHMHLNNEDLDGLIAEITASQEWRLTPLVSNMINLHSMTLPKALK